MEPSTATYERGIREFFSRDSTVQAIIKLSRSRNLTIYCGAGVTIDLTGLSWSNLIFDMITDRTVVGPEPEISFHDAETLRRAIDPLHLASILVEYNSRHSDSEEIALQALHRAIQSRLYNNGQWQSGSLCKNIIRLSYILAAQGRSVTIVTSNYDVYLEEAFRDYLEFMATVKRKESDASAGLRVFVLKQDPTSADRRKELTEHGIPPSEKGTSIELVYLHGRVPREGMIRGELVLSEADYSAAREYVEAELSASFTDREVLILGASLTDPPLLSSLARTRLAESDRTGESTVNEPTRIALLPATSTGLIEASGANFERLKPHLKARMRQFGLELLIPDFHFQVAQFCEEVIEDHRSAAYTDPQMAHRQYGERLKKWHRDWHGMTIKEEPERTFRRLGVLHKEIETIWGGAVEERSVREERLKVELWVRGDPLKDPRTLALWASSLGVLYDRPALKHERLRIGSHVAAIRAFTAGRPRHHLLTQLIEAPVHGSEGRWRQFLSVPILVPVITDGEVAIKGGDLQVGVVTLATMSQASSLPLPQARAMKSIVERMRNAGADILDCYSADGDLDALDDDLNGPDAPTITE